MGKLFGTDGVRGIVNKDLNIDLVMKIGVSVAKVIKKHKNKDLTFIVGSDTRLSKDMISSTLIGGILSEGANVINVGVLPTPAISYLVTEYKADGAFIISASHNPSEYNGIKVLDENGFKISESLEEEIEDVILNNFNLNDITNDNGILKYDDKALNLYVNHLKETIHSDISNFKILIDTANGAAYETADHLFKELNANYTIINNNPDGLNINDNAGSTHIDGLKEQVLSGKYDIGIAYDGDADRCILVDELGNEVDGDFILAICSTYLKKNNRLNNNTVVGTIMSNLGFIKYCENNDINYVATKVGDKYVLDEMLKNNYSLGGEQSGHIIFKEFANTGDGQLTSLQVLDIMANQKKKLSELASIMKKYPQVLVNVNVSKEGKMIYNDNQLIRNKIEEITKRLNNDGRIVVRPSGTENLIRVMIEGSNKDIIEDYAHELGNYIKEVLN